jgi:hypothetical protein
VVSHSRPALLERNVRARAPSEWRMSRWTLIRSDADTIWRPRSVRRVRRCDQKRCLGIPAHSQRASVWCGAPYAGQPRPPATRRHLRRAVVLGPGMATRVVRSSTPAAKRCSASALLAGLLYGSAACCCRPAVARTAGGRCAPPDLPVLAVVVVWRHHRPSRAGRLHDRGRFRQLLLNLKRRSPGAGRRRLR